MEAIPQTTDATWYPWGTSLVVRPKVDQLREQLSKTITIRFNGVDVSQVLAELATFVDIDFQVDSLAVFVEAGVRDGSEVEVSLRAVESAKILQSRQGSAPVQASGLCSEPARAAAPWNLTWTTPSESSVRPSATYVYCWRKLAEKSAVLPPRPSATVETFPSGAVIRTGGSARDFVPRTNAMRRTVSPGE